MSISFNEIPSNIRVPLFYAEFDNSRAVQGSVAKQFKVLLMGQKTSGGSATADTPVLVSSADQAKSLFGQGSMLHRMFSKYKANDKFTETWALPLADNGAGVQASGTITVTGPATADGTISLYIGGKLVEVAVSSGDSASTVAAAIDAAIDADLDLPVTASASMGVVTLTALHKGLLGNGIDIRYNYQVDEALPAGIALAIVAMASGTTAPTLTTAISNMGEVQYDVIVFPWSDATSLSAIEAELLDRWGPVRQNEGFAISCKQDTVGNLTTLGNSRNSKHVSMVGINKVPETAEEIASAVAAQVALSAAIDPARPFQTLQVKGIKAPKVADRFTFSERNTLLFDGIAQLSVAAGDVLQIERMVTTYQLNAFSSPDTSYLDAETLFTLALLRYEFKARMTSRYPRHKLAKDGIRVGPGQAILTPKVAKAEAIVIFRQWEERGLVEGIDQFKNDLVAEINSTDPNRLDMRLPPDLVNQLRVLGVQIQFLL